MHRLALLPADFPGPVPAQRRGLSASSVHPRSAGGNAQGVAAPLSVSHMDPERAGVQPFRVEGAVATCPWFAQGIMVGCRIANTSNAKMKPCLKRRLQLQTERLDQHPARVHPYRTRSASGVAGASSLNASTRFQFPDRGSRNTNRLWCRSQMTRVGTWMCATEDGWCRVLEREAKRAN